MVYFKRDGSGNGLSNIEDTFAESLQLQMSVLHQSMCIFKAGLSSLYGDWTKYKENVMGWPCREYIKTAKNGGFCEELLGESDFEAV